LNKEQSQNIEELKHILEAVEKKQGKWSENLTHYKLENFAILDQYGVAQGSLTQYINETGCMHEIPLHSSNCHHCRLVGHARHQCKNKSPTQMRRRGTNGKISALEEELKCINTCAWEEKKQIQLEQELAHLRNTNPVERFTRIKRACVAIAVSETTVGKLDHDETQATLAALSLQAETNNIDSYVSALDQMKEQEIKIQKLTQEFDEL